MPKPAVQAPTSTATPTQAHAHGGKAPDDQRTEELRLALVLNGGVSLAVWMGGVAYELNRLVRESHPMYRDLLRLTSTAARIDVISGTSAGGVNGAALALAQLHDTSLASLRDVWLETAAIDKLLRDPDERDPPSLLQGDTWFLPRIDQALRGIASRTAAPAEAVPMTLVLTTTLMHGLLDRQFDDLGEAVDDTVHRARFTFRRRVGEAEPGDQDDFQQPHTMAQLARAARSTASFPVAFEPSCFDPHQGPFAGTRLLHAQTVLPQPVGEEALLLDGGLLDNKPFDAALEAMARLPADGNTRRVLAYVVPDPRATAEQPLRDGRQQIVLPSLTDVAWRSLVGIPGAQSTATQIAELRTRNDDAQQRWQRIVGLVVTLDHGPLMATAQSLLPAYRQRRMDGAIDYLLDEIEHGLLEKPGDADAPAANTARAAGAPTAAAAGTEPDTPAGLRRSTRAWLRAVWRDTNGDPALWGARIPSEFKPDQAIVSARDGRWAWGLYSVEFMAEMVIELLRRTQRLRDLSGRWREGSGATVDGPPLPVAGGRSDWDLLDREPSAVGEAHREQQARMDDLSLQGSWRRAYRLALELRRRRLKSTASTRSAGRRGFARLVEVWRRSRGQTPPQREAQALIQALLVRRGGLGSPMAPTASSEEAANAGTAHALCELVWALRGDIEDICLARRQAVERVHHGLDDPARRDMAVAVEELDRLRRFFFGQAAAPAGTTTADAPALDRIAWCLLSLEVIEVATAARPRRTHVPSELVQISAQLGSPWGGPAEPGSKLTGMQLAHFGAFYKASWRANDWIYGRLDGIDRAIHIALNPDRLQRLYGDRQVVPEPGAAPVKAARYVFDYLHEMAVGSAEASLRPTLEVAWRTAERQIRDELAWLDKPATLPPPILQASVAALTRRLHLEVLMQELPALARAIATDDAIGAPPSNAGRQLLRSVAPPGPPRPLPPDVAIAHLKSGLLASDKLQGEAGTDQLTRTVGHAMAVAHSALSSRYGGLGAIQVLFKLTEWPIRIFYWLTARLQQGSRTTAALHGAALAAGLVLVVVSLAGEEKTPASVAAMGWSLLAGGLAATLLHSRLVGGVAAALCVALVWHFSSLVATVAVAVALVVLLALAPWLSGLAVALCLLGAAWWSAGQPSRETLEALACEWVHLACGGRAPHSAVVVQQLATLKLVLLPALTVIVVVLLATASRWTGRQLRERRLRKP